MNRRNVLLGLGTAAAGSGIVFGSGAFTQVQAERDLTIGIDDDSEALLALVADNQDIASVYEDPDSGELVIDTDRLSDDGEGFNVGSTVQIGQTNDETFGTKVSSSEYAFKLVNNFASDDGSGATDGSAGGFDGELDVAIDLTEFAPDENDATLEFVTTRDEDGDGSDLDDSDTVTGGERLVFNDVLPDEEIYVAIRIDTDSPGTDPSDLSGDVVFEAGSDLTADNFPTEEEVNNPGNNTIVNVDEEEDNDYDDIPAAVDSAGTGDTIRIGDGTYDLPGNTGSHRTLDVEGLTLEGPNAGIDGANETARGDEATINGPLMIGADDITVDGVEVNDTDAGEPGNLPGPGALQFAMGSGYGDTADNATVKNNVLIGGENDNDTNSVLAFKPEASGVVVERNLFDEDENAATDSISYGSADVEFSDNTDETTGEL